MKRSPYLSKVLLLSGGMALVAVGAALAAAPPPPPLPPEVPAGSLVAQFAAGAGIAAYGAYRIWRGKRQSATRDRNSA